MKPMKDASKYRLVARSLSERATLPEMLCQRFTLMELAKYFEQLALVTEAERKGVIKRSSFLSVPATPKPLRH
jgi:hypothetical protein